MESTVASPTWLDRLGTRWRIAMARPYVRPHSRVLDIGCGDGSLFSALDDVDRGVGIDPTCDEHEVGQVRYVRGEFPSSLDETGFDAAVALAVLEHIPDGDLHEFAAGCFRCLCPGGRAVITVPAPIVDFIVGWEQRLHLAMAPGLHQHHGFNPAATVPLFESVGFTLEKHRHFQLGMNNLFVFAKPSA